MKKTMNKKVHVSPHYEQSSSYRKNIHILVLVLLIPIFIVFIINFVILYSKNVSLMEDSLKIESTQKLELLHTSLAPMFQLTEKRRTDQYFSTQYLEKHNFMDVYFQIKKTLQQDAVWMSFFNSVSYYNCKENIVFTYNSAKSLEEYLGWETNRNSYPVASLEADFSQKYLLEQEGNQVRILEAHNVGGGEGVVFAMPLEIDANAVPKSYMIFTVPYTTLHKIFGEKEGIAYTLAYNETPVYSSEGGRGNYDTHILSVFLNARTYSWQLDGLDIKWHLHPLYFLKTIVPEITIQAITTFIVLAASLIILLQYVHKSYEPINQVLKRLPRQELKKTNLASEFQYINFMLDDLTANKEVLEQTNQEMRKEKYLYRILSGQVKPEQDFVKKCLEAGINIDRRWYACIILEDIKSSNGLYGTFSNAEKTKDRFSNFYSVEINDNTVLYLMSSDLDRETLEQRLQRLKEKENATVYISQLVEGMENVYRAYSAVRDVAAENGNTKEGEENQAEYPVLELQFLKAAVEEENIDKAEFSVNVLKENMPNYSDAVRGAVLAGAGNIFCGDKASDYIREMTDFGADSICTELDMWMKTYMPAENIPSGNRKKVLARNMHTILKYIEDNAVLPDFTIKAMAAEFGTSASNLGHQFKKATGQTLSRFIDEWKIGKAEEMLLAGESVSEVSRKLGYLSTPAFTEVFKRLRGITPSNYKLKAKREE